jgi:hypothetical protein
MPRRKTTSAREAQPVVDSLAQPRVVVPPRHRRRQPNQPLAGVSPDAISVARRAGRRYFSTFGVTSIFVISPLTGSVAVVYCVV